MKQAVWLRWSSCAFWLSIAVVRADNATHATCDLQLAAGAGCSLSGDGAALWSTAFQERRPGVVLMDAELAPRLELQPGRAPERDEGAAGCTWLAHVEHAEFPFTITVPGRYQGWARTLLPAKATWNHLESMDGGPGQWIAESNAGVFGSWYWSPLGAYDLQPGRHTFVLHNWLGGARLDALVFACEPGFKPESVTGPGVLGRGPSTGTVTSAPICPPAVARWDRLEWTADLLGGRLDAEVSLDDGRSWQPTAAGGVLPDNRPAGDGTDRLLARFILHAATDGTSPRLHSARLHYVSAPDGVLVLENDAWRLDVAARTGALCGIVEKTTGLRLTAAGVQEALLGGLAVRAPGASEQTLIGVAGAPAPSGAGQVAAPEDQLRVIRVEPRRRGLVITAHALQGQIVVTLRLLADRSALCRLQCEVDNRSPLEVIRVDFPRLGQVAVGDWSDDEAVMPQKAGERLAQPAAKTGRTLVYPGSASMAWIDLCDRQAGLYLAVNDRRLTATEIECRGGRGRRGADLVLRSHTRVAPGTTKTREFVLGIHPGDWHWAADRYREYAAGFMQRPDNPEWVTWCDGWVGTSGLEFARLGATMDRVKAEGFEYIQQWAQMADGIDQCCGNFPWPAPALGGEAGYVAGIRDVHARGGRITGYCPSRLWTRDSAINAALRKTKKEDLPAEALALIPPLEWFEQWRLYPLDGKPLAQYDAELGWFSMCPASDGWFEHQRQWIVDLIAKRWGMDGAYIDELAAAQAWPCYNLNHGHDDIGDWGRGHVRILKAVAEGGRRHNPGFCVSIEGCGDVQGQYANLHLISGLCTRPEVFHYTFPEYILINGLSNTGWKNPTETVGTAFINGDRFDARLGSAEIRTALALRQRIKRWLYPARFMDTLGLTPSTEAVQARWNRCDANGERAIVLCLRNDLSVAGATCALALPKGWQSPKALALYDREGGVRIGPATVTNGQALIPVPASTLSAALLVYRVDPAAAVDVWVETAGDQRAPGLVLRAGNLLEQPVRLALTARAAAPLGVAGLPAELTVPAGGMVEVQAQITGAAALELPAGVTVNAQWRGGNRECRATFRPLLVNGGLDVDADHDGIPDGWDVGGTTRQFPYGIEDGAFWIQGQEKEYLFLIQNLDLKPKTAYVLSGRVKKSLQVPAVRIALAEKTGENTWRIQSLGDVVKTAGEWEAFEKRLSTGENFLACQMYLYATHTAAKAWFDDIRLREAP